MAPQLSTSVPVLTSWKEIARYLGKGVRTVQRWEQDFGLPIRRPKGFDKKAVLARPRDLDAWVAIRCGTHGEREPHDGHRDMLSVRSEMATGIETSRMLRDHNRMLCAEMRSVLIELLEQVRTLERAA
jgi:hypothetical protein